MRQSSFGPEHAASRRGARSQTNGDQNPGPEGEGPHPIELVYVRQLGTREPPSVSSPWCLVAAAGSRPPTPAPGSPRPPATPPRILHRNRASRSPLTPRPKTETRPEG